ncbi:MAG: C40 family peptidase [Candidatus Marinimicrobia bacterium]|nr:C40 family peptidase [Candidatus Neomarinimicrobiota bacterium]
MKEKTGIVNISVANIRSKPKHQAALITQKLLGKPLKLYEQDGNWFFIQTQNDYKGWINSSNIQIASNETLENWKHSKKIIFTGHYGTVYQKKDKSSSPVSDLVMGDILRLEKEYKNWYKVTFPDGRSGYLTKSQAIPLSEYYNQIELNMNSIVKLARSFLGTSYLWGGTSSKAVDCSGFVKLVFIMHGITLPRNASEQSKVGKSIPIDKHYKNLQAGDLLFFGKNKVTHVGIYLGNYEYIHASGYVKINSLDKAAPNYNARRASTLLTATRILGHRDYMEMDIFKTSH